MSQRDYIIDKATDMFVSQGIKSVRMDDIAQSLGVSKRTLYELFGDKEELLYLCLQKYHASVHAHIEEQARDSSSKLESLLIGFLEMTQYSETSNRIMNNLRKFYPSVYERIHGQMGENGVKRLKDVIQECMRGGVLDSSFNIDLAITVLYYTAMGIVARKDIALPEGVSVREAFMHIVICFFRGIATEKGIRIIDDFIKSERYKHYKTQRKTII